MSILRELPNKRETLNLRIKPDERNLIDYAAKIQGKNRTDFILESARLAAEEALINQVIMTATPKAYGDFFKRLEMPPLPNDRLCTMMQTPAPWDKI